MEILQLKNVTKKIKGKEIVSDVTFDIKEGEVVGFLGPNGAGKTTTIKLILGILSPEKGQIFFRNKDTSDRKVLREALKDISCIIESPSLYTFLTGYENLEQIARMRKNISKADIDEVAKVVNLSNSINKKVKNYSLGMKQRLALAQALITKPKLLILDEPTNGLDPIGVVELRNLLKKIAKENKVGILIASHILGEVEQLCDKVIFINDGKVVNVETLDKKKEDRFIIVTKRKDVCMSVLKEASFIDKIYEKDGKLIITIKDKTPHEIMNILFESKAEIEEMYRWHETLEQKYMEVYSK